MLYLHVASAIVCMLVPFSCFPEVCLALSCVGVLSLVIQVDIRIPMAVTWLTVYCQLQIITKRVECYTHVDHGLHMPARSDLRERIAMKNATGIMQGIEVRDIEKYKVAARHALTTWECD